jgi:hypothetical protein
LQINAALFAGDALHLAHPAAGRKDKPTDSINHVERNLCKRLLQHLSEPQTKPLIRSDINCGMLIAFMPVGQPRRQSNVV